MLDQAIFLARRTLDDTSQDPRYIKTVRGFGYHWVAPVGREAPIAVDATASTSGAVVLRVRPVQLWSIVAILALLALAAAVAYWRRGSSPIAAEGETKAAAVGDIALLLPVTVEASDRHPWIRLGVMDLIAARLRAAGQPMVPSDTTIALLRDHATEPDSDEIDAMTAIAGAHLVFAAKAKASADVWQVSLRTLRGPQPPLTSYGEAPDVLEAARIAADRMALSLGFKPAPEPDTEPGLERLLRQAEAAMLAQQMDVARELIETADPEFRRHPRARLQLARIAQQGRDLDYAQAAYESLLGERVFERNRQLRAQVLAGLGAVHASRGNHEAAESVLHDAARLLDGDASLDVSIARARVNALLGGVVAMHRGVEAAREYTARARAALESSADPLGLALLEHNLGVAEALRDRYAAALNYFAISARRLRALNHIGGELSARANMIEAHLGLFEPRAASALTSRVDELLTQTTNPDYAARGHLAKAALLVNLGQWRVAEELIEEALRLVEPESHLPGPRAWALVMRAEQRARRGDLAAAGRISAEVVELALAADNTLLDDYLGRAWLLLLDARLAESASAAATEISTAMSAWAESRPTSAPRIYAALARAELAASEDRPAATESAFERALALAEATQLPLRSLQVIERYVSWLIESGLPDSPNRRRALVVTDRVARFVAREYRVALLQVRVYHALQLPTAWRAALERARAQAGDRRIPHELLTPPPSVLPLPDDGSRLTSGMP